MKNKETLEEDFISYKLAEKLFEEIYGYKPEIIEGNQQHELIVSILQKGMVYGAKWQQERSYSEEEILEAFDAGESFGSLPFSSMTTSNRLNKKDWFNKFKKK